MQRTALICTTYNCRDELGSALKTFTSSNNLELLSEIVIVDGGSTDGTWEALQNWAKKVDKIKIHQVPGANISRGRNEAIKRTTADIIVGFDSGTKYDDAWLRLILAPFEEGKADVVGGSTIAYGDTRFQKCFAVFYNNQAKADAFNPSHRGVAYLKDVWERVGGYPEHVEAGEDTWFNTQWRKMGYRYINVRDAKNYWLTRPSWSKAFKMTHRNARGHMILGESTGTLIVLSITGLYIFCILCLIGGIYNHALWYLGVILYTLYLVRRLFYSGRWRIFVRPINFLLGWYALLALDLGIVVGALEGTSIFLWHKVLGKRSSSRG